MINISVVEDDVQLNAAVCRFLTDKGLTAKGWTLHATSNNVG